MPRNSKQCHTVPEQRIGHVLKCVHFFAISTPVEIVELVQLGLGGNRSVSVDVLSQRQLQEGFLHYERGIYDKLFLTRHNNLCTLNYHNVRLPREQQFVWKNLSPPQVYYWECVH